jgi:hypothetical protein
MWLGLLLLASLSMAAPSPSGFTLRSLEVAVTVYPDGTAHVAETVRLFINDTQSIDLYEQSMQYNDLSSWMSRTGITDLRTHINSASLDLRNLRVRSREVDSCNQVVGTCLATLVLEYDVYPLGPDEPGIVTLDAYKPRTIRYTLLPGAFSLPRSATGDILLSSQIQLRVVLPEDAEAIRFSQPPSSLEDADRTQVDPNSDYRGVDRQFVWKEPLSGFKLSFEREQSLESEIFSSFSALQAGIFTTFFSPQGAAFLLLVAIGLGSVLWLHHLRTG